MSRFILRYFLRNTTTMQQSGSQSSQMNCNACVYPLNASPFMISILVRGHPYKKSVLHDESNIHSNKLKNSMLPIHI